MNPDDDFESDEHVFGEWEKEITLDGVEYLVIGEPTVERYPVRKPDGGTGTGYTYSFETIEVYVACDHPVHGRTYDYDAPMNGDGLHQWLKKHLDVVAKQACEEQQDRADREREEETYR